MHTDFIEHWIMDTIASGQPELFQVISLRKELKVLHVLSFVITTETQQVSPWQLVYTGDFTLEKRWTAEGL